MGFITFLHVNTSNIWRFTIIFLLSLQRWNWFANFDRFKPQAAARRSGIQRIKQL